MRTRYRLSIAQDWQGHPLAPAQHATLALRLVPRALLVTIDAPYYGDPAPAGPPGSTPRLWEHEVVELFVAGPGPADAVPRSEERRVGKEWTARCAPGTCRNKQG